jgi:hypothetical protein
MLVVAGEVALTDLLIDMAVVGSNAASRSRQVP